MIQIYAKLPSVKYIDMKVMDVGLHACIVTMNKSLGRKEEKYAIFFPYPY